MLRAFFLSTLVAAGPAVSADPDGEPVWGSWVLKVVARNGDGRRELGSGIPIAPDRVVTNCHVLHDAKEIDVIRDGKTWIASTSLQDAYRDLCILEVPGLAAAVPSLAQKEPSVGEAVYAVGYSGGAFHVSDGEVKGLHICPCDGGRVIQTSAAFDRGASGGGLFDRRGRLVGILTFKSGAGGRFHFALPVGWLRTLAGHELQRIASREPFWQGGSRKSGYFLTACAIGAKKDWRALSDLADEWARAEPDNPEAWVALGRARVGLNHLVEAVPAFQRALVLDSTHAEASWELQKLELDLGRDLTVFDDTAPAR